MVRRQQDYLDMLARTRERTREQEVFTQGSPILKAPEQKVTQAIAQQLARGGFNYPYRLWNNQAYAWTMSGMGEYLWQREHDESNDWKFHTLMRILRRRVKVMGPIQVGGSYPPVVPGGYQVPGQTARDRQPAVPVEFQIDNYGDGYMKQVLLVPGMPRLRASAAGGGDSLYINQSGAVDVRFMGNNASGGSPYETQPTGISIGVQAYAGEGNIEIYPTMPDAPKKYWTLGQPYGAGNTYTTWGMEDEDIIALTAPYDGVEGTGLTGTGLNASVLYPGGPTQGRPSQSSNSTAPNRFVYNYEYLLANLSTVLADPKFAPLVAWYDARIAEYKALERTEQFWTGVGDFVNSADVMIRYGWVHLRGIMWARDYRGLITFYIDFGSVKDYQGKTYYGQPADCFVALGEWEGKPTQIAVDRYDSRYAALTVLNPQPGQLYARLDGIKWPLQNG